MPRLSQEKLVEYELPSHTAEDPSKVTLNLQVTPDQVFAAKTMLEGPGTFQMLATQIKKWDYTADDGKPAPINPDTVAQMDLRDLQFLSQIVSKNIDEATKLAARAVSDQEKKSS
ncbi:hypothetical protein [Mycolicibacterium sp. PDY-3]|uniref:hypothetical protein n=1 Tax=Mycolicibacterium sp. PDY-3 TaxID=3376069 RepID=UPI00378853C6